MSLRKCSSCGKKIASGEYVSVLWKWPEEYCMVRICNKCVDYVFVAFSRLLGTPLEKKRYEPK
jgi:hypothetical protein